MQPVIPWPRTAAAVRALALLALPALLAFAPPAPASTEEFAGFDVVRAEEDDESALDHLLTRPSDAWRAEWARSPLAFRTSQGCFTSGQWYLHDQLRLATAAGHRVRFAVELDRVESDLVAYEHLDLWLLFPQRAGVLGVMFRPYYDKSRQDFALRWELGADTTRGQLRLTYGLEDLFNNLWVWRQTWVGESGQPYERHPWEPAVKVALRRERWRAEAEGRWLTLARKRLDETATEPARVQTLWGTWAAADLEARALGLAWLGRAENHQARSTDQPELEDAGDGRRTRRLWRTELGVRGAPWRDITVEARWIYMDRSQGERAPLPALGFHAVDRLCQLEACWTPRPGLALRAGGLFDRVTVDREGDATPAHGGRNESRAYVGLALRFGRVSVAGAEGIELDPERYEVWNHHDKGFLQLQAAF